VNWSLASYEDVGEFFQKSLFKDTAAPGTQLTDVMSSALTVAYPDMSIETAKKLFNEVRLARFVWEVGGGGVSRSQSLVPKNCTMLPEKGVGVGGAVQVPINSGLSSSLKLRGLTSRVVGGRGGVQLEGAVQLSSAKRTAVFIDLKVLVSGSCPY